MNTIPHQLTENVKLLHKIAIVVGDEVLLLRRSEDSTSRPGCWDTPGGNSEWPEKESGSGFDYHLEDVAREVREETGIKVEPQVFDHDSMTYFRTYFDADKHIYTMICGWKLALETKPEVIISHEHTQYQWVAIDALDEFDFGGKRGEFVKEIVSRSMEHES